MHLAAFSLILIACGAAWANTTNTNKMYINENKKKITNVDLLADKLKEQQWEEEDLPCLNIMLQGLNNSNNLTLWAVWMLDAMQLPLGQLYGSKFHIGNYDECINPPWLDVHPKYKTQYCIAEVHLASSTKRLNMSAINPEGPPELYIETVTKHGRNLAQMYWSICVPAVCGRDAVLNTYKTLLQTSHLSSYSGKADFKIESCETAGEVQIYPTGFYVFLLTLAFLFVFECWCSCYMKKYYDPDVMSYRQEIIRSFYFRRNIDSLSNIREDEIHSMNIIRLTTSFLIINGHLIFLVIGRMVINGLKVETDLDSFKMQSFAHGDIVVDTFFALSGLLLIRGFMKGNWTNPIKFLIKRYMRLIGSFMVILCYQKYVFYYTGDGPFWKKYALVEKEVCDVRLWDNIAMISNYWADTLSCYPIGWSICVDYQLSIMAVIICCIYRKNKRLGFYTFAVFLGLSTFAAGITQYINNIPALFFYGIDSAAAPRANIVLMSTYRKTHTRADSFTVGIAMGYFISLYEPAKFRRTLSKKLSYMMLIVCLVLMMGIINMGNHMYLHPDRLMKAIFAATNRNLWAVCIVVIICVCEYGDLGLNEFFSWRPVVPLSRLTYGVYIVHGAILERIFYSSRAPHKWDIFSMFVESLGIIVISMALSFLLWLIVEGPLVNLTALIVDGIKLKKTEISPPVAANSVVGNEDITKKKN